MRSCNSKLCLAVTQRTFARTSDLPCIEPLGDALKLRDTVLYLDHIETPFTTWLPSNILVWVLLAALELPTPCARLG